MKHGDQMCMHVVLKQRVMAHTHTHTHTHGAGSWDEADFRFSVSQLPPWAQKQMLSRPSLACKVESGGGRILAPSVSSPAQVFGKWAEVNLCMLSFVDTCVAVL